MEALRQRGTPRVTGYRCDVHARCLAAAARTHKVLAAAARTHKVGKTGSGGVHAQRLAEVTRTHTDWWRRQNAPTVTGNGTLFHARACRCIHTHTYTLLYSHSSVGQDGLVTCDCPVLAQELLPCQHIIGVVRYRAIISGVVLDLSPYIGKRWTRLTEPFKGRSYQGIRMGLRVLLIISLLVPFGNGLHSVWVDARPCDCCILIASCRLTVSRS
jgi:hypothetical protein